MECHKGFEQLFEASWPEVSGLNLSPGKIHLDGDDSTCVIFR